MSSLNSLTIYINCKFDEVECVEHHSSIFVTDVFSQIWIVSALKLDAGCGLWQFPKSFTGTALLF